MAPPTVPPAERIRELSVINTDLAAMLASAGHAIHALTNRPIDSNDDDDDDDDDTRMLDGSTNTDDDHRKVFRKNTEAYFNDIQSIFARLRRQAYALEEAGIIAPDPTLSSNAPARTMPPPPASGPQQPGGIPQAPKQEQDTIRNGGLGKFDVGWLNSRTNRVGEGKEAELVQEAKELLEKVLSKGNG